MSCAFDVYENYDVLDIIIVRKMFISNKTTINI
jgi:hypothetical protein